MGKRRENSYGESTPDGPVVGAPASITRIAHLTDTHITPTGKPTAVLKDRGIDILEDLLAQAKAADVRTVLFGGDNIDNGADGANDMAAFLDVVQPVESWRCVMGNHEAKPPIPGSGKITQEDFLKAVDGHGIGPGKTSFSEAFGNVRVVGINTTLLGNHGGFVTDETFSFLARELKNSTEEHIIVLGHHLLTRPWAPSKLDVWDDEYLVKNRDVVNALLSAHPRVRAYLCGHHHASRIDRIAGRGGQDGFYHILTPSSAAFPHGGRILSFEEDALVVETIEPRIEGLMTDGMKAVQGGRKARRFATLGTDGSFIEYVGGRESDKFARLPYRLRRVKRMETVWRAVRQEAI
jgi:3',5'-cyclic-AMP phosphodiesterase